MVVKMINPFKRFYDTEISVYESGEDAYSKKGEKTLLGSVVCDIQPYSDDTENKLYGLSGKRSYKLFCDRNELIKKGRYVSFCGVWYMIVRTEMWSFGMTAVMRSVENEA